MRAAVVARIAAACERSRELGLRRADDEREDRVECGEAVGVREAPSSERGDQRVGHGETGGR